MFCSLAALPLSAVVGAPVGRIYNSDPPLNPLLGGDFFGLGSIYL